MTAHPKRHYQNKVVCVTGAGGSIGSQICRTLIDYEAARIIMVARSEIDLFRIERELRDKAPAGALVTVLGSITDQRLMEAMFRQHQVDVVVNAAAHKHVPLCEQNPEEAVLNNLGGVAVLAAVASRYGVQQFVQISTDKAVKPASVMGATKRACELFLKYFAPRSTTKFTIVRFGNVVDSSGSVLPIWRQQLRSGKKLTITDKRCTRYLMSIPDAARLALSAAALARPDDLFVLDMGQPHNLYDLAKLVVAEVLYPGADCHTPDDHIEEIGLRPGEKLHEEITYGGTIMLTDYPGVLRVREHEAGPLVRWEDFQNLLSAAKVGAKNIMLEQMWELVG